jgi:VCBS repeat protein/ASPIC/UnbV protein
MRVVWLCVLMFAAAAQTSVPRFEPMQREQMVLGGSFVNAWADPDLDGDPDLFVGFNGTPNRLYRNDAGVLTDIAAEVGVADARATRAAAWGDYDADGDPDLLVGFAPGAGSVLRLYRNDRSSPQAPLKFTDVTDAAGLAVPTGAVRQPAWIDLDADGDLDLFVAFRDRANVLFRNDAVKFTDIAPAVGLADSRKSVGAVWFDYDEDGDFDVYVANMDGDANGLYRNDKGMFTDVAAAAGLEWGGRAPKDTANGTVRPCAADVDGDGHFDLFTANYGPNGLFLNKGGGKFEDVSRAWGIAIDARYDTCLFGDFDNDGRIDLYVNGTVTGGTSYRDHLFRNAGGRFEDVTPENIVAIQADHGAAWADVDADGDVDLALTGSRPDGMHWIMRNTLAPPATARSVIVRVLNLGDGRATRAGAEVRVYAAGTTKLLGAALVDSGSGYDTQNELPVHIGLPSLSPVDVEVTFPAFTMRSVTKVLKVNPVSPKGRVIEVRIGPAK